MAFSKTILILIKAIIFLKKVISSFADNFLMFDKREIGLVANFKF